MTDIERNGRVDGYEFLGETDKDEHVVMAPSTTQTTTALSIPNDGDGDNSIDEMNSNNANDAVISQSAAKDQDASRIAQHEEDSVSSDGERASQDDAEIRPSYLHIEGNVTETPAMIHSILEEEDLQMKNQNHVDATILPVAKTNVALSVVSNSRRDNEQLEMEAKSLDKTDLITETPSSTTYTALTSRTSMKLGRTNNLSFAASDSFAIPQPPPLPSLRRHTGVQWATTPGAFRLSISSPFSSTLSSVHNRSRIANNTHSDDSNSDSESHADNEISDEQTRESLESSARSRDLPLPRNDPMLARQWSSRRNLTFATTPVEATLVLSTYDNTDDMDIPPPPGLPVATISDEIIVAEAIQFTQKNIPADQLNDGKSRVSRILISVALLVVGAAIAVMIKFLLPSKDDTPPTISYHAVVFGGRTPCPGSPLGKLHLFCAGRQKDSSAQIEILYNSSDVFCEIESNKARCYVRPSSSTGQYQFVNSGVLFSCKRKEYVDDFHVVTSAVYKLYNNSQGCSVADISEPGYNRSIELSAESVNENTTKFIGLGHFCRLRDPQTKETNWKLKRNVVVQDAVLMPEQCETVGAIYTARKPTMLSYCYFPDRKICDQRTSPESTSFFQACNSSMLSELYVTDSFSECQDSNVTVSIETLRILTNDAIEESRSFPFSYGYGNQSI